MAGSITTEFNRICTAAGVQCTVTTDPKDYKKIFQLKNLGSHGVEFTYDKASYILNPTDEMELKTERGEEPKMTQWFVTYDRAFNQ